MRPPPSPRAARFTYGPFEVDEAAGVLTCHYYLDGSAYTETITFGPARAWNEPARHAARLVHLLAGVSYYKAGAPPVVDLGPVEVHPGEAELLRSFYVDGLGEFAYRNGLDLHDLVVAGGSPRPAARPGAAGEPSRPLVPFGGGIDSIVVAEAVKAACPGAALFVLNRAGVAPFAAIERAAAVTSLPVVRAERALDPAILAPPRPVLNGHVPVTGILSAIAAVAAALDGRGRVVMSNERSASRANLVHQGREVNHQWSKSAVFEDGFRSLLAGAVDYFSLLRPVSELWVAERFARLDRYHPVVHSCNRAFTLDPARRLDRWCGQCDKCCFIDLVLSPFLPPESLERIFGGTEPLGDPALIGRFRALAGTGGAKPWECVGDIDECRAALTLAAARPDRAGNPTLALLAAEAGTDPAAAAALLRPSGPHHIPGDLAPAVLS